MVWLKASKFNVVVTIKDGETFYCTNYETYTLNSAISFRDTLLCMLPSQVVAMLNGDWIVQKDDGRHELFRGELSDWSGFTIEIDTYAIDIDGTKMLVDHDTM